MNCRYVEYVLRMFRYHTPVLYTSMNRTDAEAFA